MSSAALQVFEFEGAQLRASIFRGRPCWVAQDIGAGLHYTPDGWRAAFGGWTTSEELDADDYLVLRGAELREFKAGCDARVQQTLAKTTQLTVLFESGVNGVCLLTEKPLGRSLRRYLRREVMPQLLRGRFDQSRAEKELVDLSLRLDASKAETIWEATTVRELCRVHAKPEWTPPQRMPLWLKGPMGRIYRIVLGETVYRELKSRNPDPHDGSLNYQFLTDARHKLMERDMQRVLDALRQSVGAREFYNRLRFVFGRAPLQLAWGA